MACDKYRDDLLPLFYGELSDGRSSEVESHIAVCSMCREELESMKDAIGLVRRLPRESVPAAAKGRAISAVRRESGSRHRLFWGMASAAGIIIAVVTAFVFTFTGPGPLGPRMASAETSVVQRGYAVTVFNQNLAMVKDRRDFVNMKKGVTTVELKGIPARILPDSISFKDLDDPEGTTVLEQNYEFDLAGATAILDKYKASDPDKPESAKKITVVRKDGTEITGVLFYYAGFDTLSRWQNPPGGGFEYGYSAEQRSFRGQQSRRWRPRPVEPKVIGLRMEDGSIKQIRGQEIKAVRLGEMPENLRTKPTLVWQLQASKGGLHQSEVSYLTEGMSWRCDYRLTFDNSNKLSMGGWVTVNNYSGVTFPNAKVKLMAGDVHMVPRSQLVERLADKDFGESNRAAMDPGAGFKEKSFAEYHLYTLQRKATLNDNEVKQIELMDKDGIKWGKKYEYNYRRRSDRVIVFATFRNFENNNLGMPLPKGRIRLFGLDHTGEPEFAGEDNIDHTPKDEEVKVRMGYAFDIVVERKLLKNVGPRSRRDGEQEIEIKLRNHKDKEVTVEVFEPLAWTGFTAEVLESSHEFEKEAANMLRFTIKIKADSEVKLLYRVQYLRQSR
ncbi:MAG: DUF4139 domain-containing protein [Planctomycetota bacterium]|nr:MAG: DUF4139 domain-containing protein [Planctomycetota bacterium]